MLFTPLWGTRLVYGKCPEHEQKHDSDKLRFSLQDIACLFVYLAIANALFRLIRDEYDFFPNLFVFMIAMTNLLAIFAWILALRFADRWNVTTTFERVLAMLIFFPLSAVVVAQIMMCSLGLLSDYSLISIASFGMILFDVVVIYTLRWSWRWVRSKKGVPSDPPEPRNEAF